LTRQLNVEPAVLEAQELKMFEYKIIWSPIHLAEEKLNFFSNQGWILDKVELNRNDIQVMFLKREKTSGGSIKE